MAKLAVEPYFALIRFDRHHANMGADFLPSAAIVSTRFFQGLKSCGDCRELENAPSIQCEDFANTVCRRCDPGGTCCSGLQANPPVTSQVKPFS